MVIHPGISASCRQLFISVASLSWVKVNFLNRNICMPSWSRVFQFCSFVSVALSESRCTSTFGSSSSIQNSFFCVVFPFNFFVPFPYFAQKSLCLPNILLLVCLHPFSFEFRVFFSFVALECPVLFFVFFVCTV